MAMHGSKPFKWNKPWAFSFQLLALLKHIANTNKSPTFLTETNCERNVSRRQHVVYFASHVCRTRTRDLVTTRTRDLTLRTVWVVSTQLWEFCDWCCHHRPNRKPFCSLANVPKPELTVPFFNSTRSLLESWYLLSTYISRWSWMKSFIGTVQRITTARHVARTGNEKRKNVIVLEKYAGKTPTWKTWT